jgi:hypothetical protein
MPTISGMQRGKLDDLLAFVAVEAVKLLREYPDIETAVRETRKPRPDLLLHFLFRSSPLDAPLDRE